MLDDPFASVNGLFLGLFILISIGLSIVFGLLARERGARAFSRWGVLALTCSAIRLAAVLPRRSASAWWHAVSSR